MNKHRQHLSPEVGQTTPACERTGEVYMVAIATYTSSVLGGQVV